MVSIELLIDDLKALWLSIHMLNDLKDSRQERMIQRGDKKIPKVWCWRFFQRVTVY